MWVCGRFGYSGVMGKGGREGRGISCIGGRGEWVSTFVYCIVPIVIYNYFEYRVILISKGVVHM
jgi:hypothetical protein